MTSLIATADIHINGGRWGGSNPETGRSRASETTYAIWLGICRRAVEEGAALLSVGDLFLDGHPRPEDVEMLADGYRLLADAGLECVIVRGNHDPRHLPLGQRDPLGRYGDLAGVHVATTPEIVRLASGVAVVCLPWPRAADYLAAGEAEGLGGEDVDLVVAARAADRLGELVDEATACGGPVVVAAHCTVDTAKLGSSRRGSEVALGKLLHEPVLPLTAFDREGVTHVALGHIHRRQHLSERVWYCGSPDRVDFGEEDQEKAYSLIHIDGTSPASVESVPVAARTFRTIDLGADGDISQVTAAAGDIVRLRIDARCEVSEPEARRAVADAGAEVVQIVVVPAPDAERERRSVAEDIGPIEGLRAWLDGCDTGLPEDEVVAAAQRLLAETNERSA
jgi:exonuclease SbcD